jgi:hypothetical protein
MIPRAGVATIMVLGPEMDLEKGVFIPSLVVEGVAPKTLGEASYAKSRTVITLSTS